MLFDLDAARAARRETQGEAPTVIFGGETFTLPAELGLDAAEHLMYGRPTAFVQALLAEDESRDDKGRSAWERFHAHKPTLADLKDLADMLAEAYGFTTPGESQASPSSSTSTGTTSRPTSSVTTASRSVRRATAKKTGSRSAVSKSSSPGSPKNQR